MHTAVPDTNRNTYNIPVLIGYDEKPVRHPRQRCIPLRERRSLLVFCRTQLGPAIHLLGQCGKIGPQGKHAKTAQTLPVPGSQVPKVWCTRSVPGFVPRILRAFAVMRGSVRTYCGYFRPRNISGFVIVDTSCTSIRVLRGSAASTVSISSVRTASLHCE